LVSAAKALAAATTDITTKNHISALAAVKTANSDYNNALNNSQI